MSKVELRKARERDMKEVIKEQEIEDATGFRGDPTLYLKRMPGKGFEKKYEGEIPSEFKGKLMYVARTPDGSVSIYSDKLEKEVFPRRLADEEIGTIDTGMDGKDEYFFFETFEIIEPPVKEKLSIEQIKDAREERKKIKKQTKKKAKRKAQDKEIKELKKQLQDTLKNDPNLPIRRMIPAGGLSEFIPPQPNPEQAKAIKNLRDINDIAVKDTSSNLKGDVNKLISLYGIR